MAATDQPWWLEEMQSDRLKIFKHTVPLSILFIEHSFLVFPITGDPDEWEATMMKVRKALNSDKIIWPDNMNRCIARVGLRVLKAGWEFVCVFLSRPWLPPGGGLNTERRAHA